MSEADGWGGLRTVCHGCRTMREVVEQVETHRFEVRAMIIPGDGTIFRRVRATFETADVVVEIPCPDCARPDPDPDEDTEPDEDTDAESDEDEEDEDTPEWLIPGFVPPA